MPRVGSPRLSRRTGRARSGPPLAPPPAELNLTVQGVTADFVREIVDGTAREIACFGPRGERKTSAALVGFIGHAKRHATEGHPLPVNWMGVTDTFQSHVDKTLETLRASHWKGTWKLSNNKHRATFRAGGTNWLSLNLFGIEDEGAMDRVRRECHGVWFEEPAPAAVLVKSSGVSDTAWRIAITSQRLASYRHPAVMTLNYPDEDHWTWQRFVAQPAPGTTYFRIPPGENSSPEARAEWEKALAGRPDLLARLLRGEPGVVLLGEAVAQGFREDLHVAKARLYPIQGEPLALGQDFGHTPATIIGQTWRGAVRVYAGLPCAHGGLRQHFQNSVIPWLERYAPWALKQPEVYLNGEYDPAGNTAEQTDIEQSPIRMIEAILGGRWLAGVTSWEGRKHPLLKLLNAHTAPGQPALQIDPVDGKLLSQALSGRWYYRKDRLGRVSRDVPMKPNHPWEDLGDALCYFAAKVAVPVRPPQPMRVDTAFVPGVDSGMEELTVEV